MVVVGVHNYTMDPQQQRIERDGRADVRRAADRAGFLPEFDILVRFGYAPANVFQALTTEVEHRTRDQVISMPTEFLVERVLRFIR